MKIEKIFAAYPTDWEAKAKGKTKQELRSRLRNSKFLMTRIAEGVGMSRKEAFALLKRADEAGKNCPRIRPTLSGFGMKG